LNGRMKRDGAGKRFLGRARASPDQAGFVRRGLALLVDFATVMILSVIIFLAFSEIRAAGRGGKGEWTKLKEAIRAGSSVTIRIGKVDRPEDQAGEEQGAKRVQIIGGETLDLIYEFLVGYAYFILCFRFGGRTLGKRLFGLRVVDLKGHPRLGWYQSFERTHGYAASALSGSIGFFQVLWDREGLAMHDKISGTTVVRLARRQAGRGAKKPEPQKAGKRKRTIRTGRE